MSVPRPLTRQAARGLTLAILAATGASVSVGAGSAAARPTLHTDHGCYLVGQPVKITGSGFTPGRTFDLADDGVDFGQSTTDAGGAFSVSFRPGGLGAGIAQHVGHLDADDGSSNATATFTLTRAAGARFLASGGNPNTLTAPFEVWGFALDGRRRNVFVHYVSPGGRVRTTVSLGRTGGQCGYLRTARRRVFPFSPSVGNWVLQLDTARAYARRPSGPVARIGVRIG